MWLSWHAALLFALATGIFVLLARGSANRWVRAAVTTGRELILVLCVYAMWQRVKEVSTRKTTEALGHGRWVWHAERWLHLPSELTLQRGLVPHSLLTQACNVFYATVHVPAMIATLVWLFARHRDRYRWVRDTLAGVTAACLLVQFIPVAPPRMFPDLGFIDTGLRYGQSVYGTGGSGVSNQLAAMPSIHVGWAVLVAVGVIGASTSRWRWLVLAHPVMTMYAVMATGNHWWLDGIVAALLLGAVAIAPRPWPRTEAHKARSTANQRGSASQAMVE